MPSIYTIASLKGGVGKSTIAYELAYLLDAVLLDFEWDGGGVSTTWGYNAESRINDALLGAIERDRTPRVLTGHRKPDLVPGSPYLPDAEIDAEDFGRVVAKWAADWGRDVVVDTHPGASPSANGAMSESRLVLVPTPLRTKDLNATEKMIRDMLDYPIAIVPNLIRRTPPAAELVRLERMVAGTPVQVAPLIADGGRAVDARKKRMAMTADDPPARAIGAIVGQFNDLARFVREYRND